MQNKFFAAHDDGVPGDFKTSLARDNVGYFAEQIDNPAFALIAPLRADDDDVLCHLLNFPLNFLCNPFA